MGVLAISGGMGVHTDGSVLNGLEMGAGALPRVRQGRRKGLPLVPCQHHRTIQAGLHAPDFWILVRCDLCCHVFSRLAERVD